MEDKKVIVFIDEETLTKEELEDIDETIDEEDGSDSY